jgi:hypothetical protein
VFSDLPAIFARDLTEDSSQVQQGMLKGFGTRKMGAQALMKLIQAGKPAANGPQSCPGGFGCGRVKRLHACFAFDGSHNEEVLVLLACHIGARRARSFFRSGDNAFPNWLAPFVVIRREKSREKSGENGSL